MNTTSVQFYDKIKVKVDLNSESWFLGELHWAYAMVYSSLTLCARWLAICVGKKKEMFKNSKQTDFSCLGYM